VFQLYLKIISREDKEMTLLKDNNPKNINIALLSIDNKVKKVENVGSKLIELEEKINNSNITDISALETAVNQNTALINAETNNRELADITLQNNIDNKVDKEVGKGLSTNDFTDADKTKLDSLENTVVDSALSSTSTNPVQNKVVNSALSGKVDKVSGKGLSTNDFTDADKATLDSLASGGSLTIVSLWSGTSSTANAVLTMAHPYTDYKFILVCAAMYSNANAQRQYMLIPSSQCSLQTATNSDDFKFECSISGTIRSLRFKFPTASTLAKLASEGTASHLPVITNVWGIN
jgi:hypothetical protein